jgi:hypothetical protein
LLPSRVAAPRGALSEAVRAGCWLTAGCAVDLLAEDVGATSVAGRLAGHMGQKPPERQPLAADAAGQQRLRVTGEHDRRSPRDDEGVIARKLSPDPDWISTWVSSQVIPDPARCTTDLPSRMTA